eukprot:284818800_1
MLERRAVPLLGLTAQRIPLHVSHAAASLHGLPVDDVVDNLRKQKQRLDTWKQNQRQSIPLHAEVSSVSLMCPTIASESSLCQATCILTFLGKNGDSGGQPRRSTGGDRTAQGKPPAIPGGRSSKLCTGEENAARATWLHHDMLEAVNRKMAEKEAERQTMLLERDGLVKDLENAKWENSRLQATQYVSHQSPLLSCGGRVTRSVQSVSSRNEMEAAVERQRAVVSVHRKCCSLLSLLPLQRSAHASTGTGETAPRVSKKIRNDRQSSNGIRCKQHVHPPLHASLVRLLPRTQTCHPRRSRKLRFSRAFVSGKVSWILPWLSYKRHSAFCSAPAQKIIREKVVKAERERDVMRKARDVSLAPADNIIRIKFPSHTSLSQRILSEAVEQLQQCRRELEDTKLVL